MFTVGCYRDVYSGLLQRCLQWVVTEMFTVGCYRDVYSGLLQSCLQWIVTELFTVGCYRVVYSGLLQRCLQWVVTELFTVEPILPLFFRGQYLDVTLGVLPNLISLGIFLKCLEDTSEEACDAGGVHVVLQNQRWGGRDLRIDGRTFDHKLHSNIRWWAVCAVFLGQLQFGEGVLFIL